MPTGWGFASTAGRSRDRLGRVEPGGSAAFDGGAGPLNGAVNIAPKETLGIQEVSATQREQQRARHRSAHGSWRDFRPAFSMRGERYEIGLMSVRHDWSLEGRPISPISLDERRRAVHGE